MLHLDTLVQSVPRITASYGKVLNKLGVKTVRDFLFYFPFRYDDFSKIVPLAPEHIGQTITVEGKIIRAKNIRIFRKRMTITEAIIQDKNNISLKIAWFNQPYILENLSVGSFIRVAGKLIWEKNSYFMSNPAWEKSSREETNTGRLVPVYSETSGITSRWIRWQIKTLLPLAKNISEILPEEIRKKYSLYNIQTAISQIHFPDSEEKLKIAQKRIAFQEMFLTQLKALEIKKDWEEKNSLVIKFDEKLIRDFVKNLPFKLTDAQRKASFEILRDLEKTRPMNRLLNGDVGSGKTVVAAIASLQAVSAGYQVAVMAPTEVLARQHFESFSKLFKNSGFNIALLTNSYKIVFQNNKKKEFGRKDLLDKIFSEKINLIIGTHALIQKDIRFKNLALTVIDEQHRFGVAQRAELQNKTININDGNKKTVPHFLTMTATPIPRTLAIAYFGSLDLSILNEMPKNRKPIITKIVPSAERNKIYEFVKSEIRKGRQAFVILPLIEESLAESMADVKAAKAEYDRLSKKIFPQLKLGLLHGRLKAKEKEIEMENFKNKKTDILVSTSVVEVGVDIPDASVMIIENSERFGLSQLHQFRGRVGRAEHQSYCFLFSENDPERLKILEKTGDGFRIAEKDLELRGPGKFFGTLQSGLPDIAMKNLTNVKLIKFARAEAQEILGKDPELKKQPALRENLKKFSDKIHLE
jgi:ATP-dependent DNA helicase RecG